MAKTPIAKTPSIPKHDEPHIIEVADLESYTAMLQQEPYTYLPKLLPQYVINLMLQEAARKGKRLVRLLLPRQVVNRSYQNNPSQFAVILRKMPTAPFRYVTAYMTTEGVFRITASDEKGKKANGYMTNCCVNALAQYEKVAAGKQGWSLLFPYTDMPQSYQINARVFKHNLQKMMREKGNDPDLNIVAFIMEEGIRVSSKKEK